MVTVSVESLSRMEVLKMEWRKKPKLCSILVFALSTNRNKRIVYESIRSMITDLRNYMTVHIPHVHYIDIVPCHKRAEQVS